MDSSPQCPGARSSDCGLGGRTTLYSHKEYESTTTAADAYANANANANADLTAYEQFRAKNIERNQNRLAQLGLITNEEAMQTIEAAWKKNHRVKTVLSKTGTGTGTGKSRSKKKEKGGRTGSSVSVPSHQADGTTPGWNMKTRGNRNQEQKQIARVSTHIRKGKWAIPRKEKTIAV